MMAYVINLERRADRLDNFLRQWKNNVRIFKAVDGRTLTLDDYIFNKFKMSGLMFDRYKIACFLSHISILREIRDRAIDGWSFVFEDDVQFECSSVEVFRSVIGINYMDVDLVYLGGLIDTHKPKSIQSTVSPFLMENDFRIACSYALTLHGVRKILDIFDSEPPVGAYDVWLNELSKKGVHLYVLKNEVCKASTKLGTDVQGKIDSLLPQLKKSLIHIANYGLSEGECTLIAKCLNNEPKSFYNLFTGPDDCDYITTKREYLKFIEPMLKKHPRATILICHNDGVSLNISDIEGCTILFSPLKTPS